MWDLPDTHRRVLEQLRDGDSDDTESGRVGRASSVEMVIPGPVKSGSTQVGSTGPRRGLDDERR